MTCSFRPVFTRVFVDYYLVEELKDWVRPLLIGMAITALFRAALTYLQRERLRLRRRYRSSPSTLEQGHPAVGLKVADVLTDSTLGQRKFVSRARKAAQANSRLEGAQGL